jgi:hypothetical protein
MSDRRKGKSRQLSSRERQERQEIAGRARDKVFRLGALKVQEELISKNT